jgi:hypothetical protein
MKLNPEVYRNAIKKLDDPFVLFACVAISASEDGVQHREEFERLFETEDPRQTGCAWFGNYFDPENRLAREIALDLMAEIVESESL